MERIDNNELYNLYCYKEKIFNVSRDELQSAEKSGDDGSSKKMFIYKRHDKSLYELSKKFLVKHWHLTEYIINLENLTHELDIERRRLYDIINILESLGIIYRVSKNSFMWKGVDKIRKNLKKFEQYFTSKHDITKSSDEILEHFVECELENFNFKKNKREKSLAL